MQLGDMHFGPQNSMHERRIPRLNGVKDCRRTPVVVVLLQESPELAHWLLGFMKPLLQCFIDAILPSPVHHLQQTAWTSNIRKLALCVFLCVGSVTVQTKA